MLWLMRGGAPCFINAFIQNSQYSYYLKNRSMLLVGLQSRGSDQLQPQGLESSAIKSRPKDNYPCIYFNGIVNNAYMCR